MRITNTMPFVPFDREFVSTDHQYNGLASRQLRHFCSYADFRYSIAEATGTAEPTFLALVDEPHQMALFLEQHSTGPDTSLTPMDFLGAKSFWDVQSIMDSRDIECRAVETSLLEEQGLDAMPEFLDRSWLAERALTIQCDPRFLLSLVDDPAFLELTGTALQHRFSRVAPNKVRDVLQVPYIKYLYSLARAPSNVARLYLDANDHKRNLGLAIFHQDSIDEALSLVHWTGVGQEIESAIFVDGVHLTEEYGYDYFMPEVLTVEAKYHEILSVYTCTVPAFSDYISRNSGSRLN